MPQSISSTKRQDLSELPHWLIWLAVLSLAIGIFVSVAACAAYHILLVIAALFAWRTFKWSELPTSAKFILLLALTSVLSAVANAATMENSIRAVLKMKYPLFGVLGVVLLGSLPKTFVTESRIRLTANLFLASITVASTYGILKVWGFDVLTLSVCTGGGQAAGLTGIMRYNHGIQMVLVLLAGILVYRKQVPPFYNRGLFLAAFGTGLVGLWEGATRGALVGFLCAIPFVFFFQSRKRFWFSTVICWPLALFIVFGNYLNVGSRIPTIGATNNPPRVLRGMKTDDRLSLYQAALFMLREKPLLGHGPGQFVKQALRISGQHGLGHPVQHAHAHNVFLETAANLGAIGLIALLGWLGCWIHELWMRKDLVAKCVLPFVCAFIVGAQSEYTFDANNSFLIFFVYSASSIATWIGIKTPVRPTTAIHGV